MHELERSWKHLIARRAFDRRHDDPLDCVENPARLVANDWNVQHEAVQAVQTGIVEST
jgi:hypothetical protein